MEQINSDNKIVIAFTPQELEDVADAVCFRYKNLRDKDFKHLYSYIKAELIRERDSLEASLKSFAKIMGISEERLKISLERGTTHD